MSTQYQRGSIRRIKRSNGEDAWEWRYRVKGLMKQETYSAAEFKTAGALWKHLEPAIKNLNAGDNEPVPLAATVGDVIKRYEREHLPELAKSTQDTDRSMLHTRIEPKWGKTPITELHADEVEAWLKSLKLSAASKGRARRMLKQLFDKAQFWRMIPLQINPMTLVKVKGVSKREKKIQILTVEQVNQLVEKLPQPYSRMVLVAAGLGLRVSEALALKWEDIDFEKKTVTVCRAYTHGALKEAKTETSEATLPISSTLLDALKPVKGEGEEWVFPSPVTGKPYGADTILHKIIKPAAVELGLPKIGWHSFRHSYKSWIGGSSATLAQQKDMMRHADITTTANIYGGTPVEEMRPLNEAVAGKLKAKPTRPPVATQSAVCG